MNILVTGGAGFIGSHVVDILIKEGHKVSILDNLSTGQRENINLRATFIEMDLCDGKALEEVFKMENYDAVYHLAAQIDVRKSVENPVSDAQINIMAAIHLIDLASKNGIKKIVFSSTGGAIYGDGVSIPTPETAKTEPISPYGCAKLSIEHYLHYYHIVHGLSYTILRYANVYGPRQNPKGEAGVVSLFLDAMLKKKTPTIFGGLQTRDFVFVEDVARANLLALADEKSEIYNVATGVEKDIIALFSTLNGFFGGEFKAEFAEKKKGEQQRSCLDSTKIQEKLGWKAENSFEDGLGKTYLYFKNKY